MQVETIKLENVDSFNLEHIFECGQCFRWNKNEDNSYTGVVEKKVLQVKKIDTKTVSITIYQNKAEEVRRFI